MGCHVAAIHAIACAPPADASAALAPAAHLCAVLDEEGVAHDVVGDVVADVEAVGAVHRQRAAEGVVDGAVLEVRGEVDVAVHVEVDRVPMHRRAASGGLYGVIE